MTKVEVMIGEAPSLEASIPEYRVIGTTHHSQLSERDLPDQHPISAITGLGEALDEAINSDKLQEAVEDALTVAKESGEFKGDPGEKGADGASGVYFGSDTPPESANVWINPNGEPTGTEDWQFDLDDGTSDMKTVVVIDSDESTQNGILAILKFKQEDGTWAEIPAIKGEQGIQGERGLQGIQGVQGVQGVKGDKGDTGPAGASGVHIGSDTPPETASVWINPNGEPTGTEDWQFDLDDGTSDTKTVVVIDSDDSTSNSTLATLRFKKTDGTWAEIPAIKGEKGAKGDTGPQGATGATGAQGPQGLQGIQGEKGDKGDKGDAGSDANVTSANISSALGYTPAKAADITALINRSTAVNAADTNYTTLMARGSSLNNAETSPAVNGAIAWTYE